MSSATTISAPRVNAPHPFLAQVVDAASRGFTGAIDVRAVDSAGRGLQQYAYRALLDRTRSEAGRFTVCGHLVDPQMASRSRLLSSTVPVVRTEGVPA